MKTKLDFCANETLKEVNIEIVDDDIWEPDEFFYAKLFVDHDDVQSRHVIIGSVSINQITIINDDGKSSLFQNMIEMDILLHFQKGITSGCCK